MSYNYMMNHRMPDMTGLAIYILDEEPASYARLSHALAGYGARILTGRTPKELAHAISREKLDVLMVNLESANTEVSKNIEEYRSGNPGGLLYIVSDHDFESIEATAEMAKLMVDDYLRKPIDPARFAHQIETTLGRPWQASKELTITEPLITRTKPYFLFRSPAMHAALRNLPAIAESNETVLISGETGTGKEIVARTVHMLSRRSHGPFVPVNCGAIPETLIEGELFGHEKGAFTGAHRMRKGKFESAERGTLFLDEIGDMPMALQVRLLRALEERVIYRVGAEEPVDIDVRVIAATQIDLERAVHEGIFREDLYYRLNVLKLHMPPLRERIEDIPLLALHFLERALSELNRPLPYPTLSGETIYLLEQYPWKGNVRELRNLITRIATLLPKGISKVLPVHVTPHLRQHGAETAINARIGSNNIEGNDSDGVLIRPGTTLDQAEARLIEDTLLRTGGNRTHAAKMLGIGIRTLRRKINLYRKPSTN